MQYGISRNHWLLLFGSVFLVYLFGIFGIDIMDVDASQYASMSREMAETGNYLQVHHRYHNYLDKPPLLFWLSAIAYKIFGVSHAVYRLPSLLFTVLGAYSTFRFGQLLYKREVGVLAALVLLTTQAFFLISHDVRTDTILANAVIFAIWQLFVFLETRKTAAFIWGFVGVGLAMLQKGPIGLMVPVLALGTHLVYYNRWKDLFNLRWLLGAGIVLVLLSPMLWGLYQQFDAQPNAAVNGDVGVSGLRFYFWTQSFGRLTGESVWANDTGPLFFVHTFLWSFAPWMCLAYWGLFRRLSLLLRKKWPTGGELITLAGVLLPFLALSASRYKLPHYIFVFYPLMAIIVAQEIDRFVSQYQAGNTRMYRIFFTLQNVLVALIWLLAFVLCLGVFEVENWWTLGALAFLGATLAVYFKQTNAAARLILPTALTAIGFNWVMHTHFYPQLLEYQSTSQAAHYIKANDIPCETLYFSVRHAHALEFYAECIATHKAIEDVPDAVYKEEVLWLYADEKHLSILQHPYIELLDSVHFKNQSVTLLTLPFLNKNTREKAAGDRYLLQLRTTQPVEEAPIGR